MKEPLIVRNPAGSQMLTLSESCITRPCTWFHTWWGTRRVVVTGARQQRAAAAPRKRAHPVPVAGQHAHLFHLGQGASTVGARAKQDSKQSGPHAHRLVPVTTGQVQPVGAPAESHSFSLLSLSLRASATRTSMGVRSARRHTRTVSSQPPLARCSPLGLQLSLTLSLFSLSLSGPQPRAPPWACARPGATRAPSRPSHHWPGAARWGSSSAPARRPRGP
jgi:hypothetical protein